MIGTGYVGLSLSVIISRLYPVVTIDIVEEKIDKVNRGISPIKETDLELWLSSGELNLKATDDYSLCFDADFAVIAVPTNYDPDADYFDTHIVESAIRKVLRYNPNVTIVIKSTVPIGYTKSICDEVGYNKILFSPEFLREGQSVRDGLNPSRIIVGTPNDDYTTMEKAKRFADLLEECAEKKNIEKIIMGSTEAESVKLFSNSYLAMRVAFFNELDTFGLTNGLNVSDIVRGVCLDPRIGSDYNNPSFGYGGYCFPKDTKQLLANYKGIPNNIVRAIVESNDSRKEYITEEIKKRISAGGIVGVYRLAMKAGSDNSRDSSILYVMQLLKDDNINIIIYDPAITSESFNGFEVCKDLSEFIDRSEIIVANRVDDVIRPFAEKLFTRDIFGRD